MDVLMTELFDSDAELSEKICAGCVYQNRWFVADPCARCKVNVTEYVPHD